MLDQIKVAQVSTRHVTGKDWERLSELATSNSYIQTEDSEGYLDFRWFDIKWSVMIHLGNLYVDRAENQVYDADVYQLVIDQGLSNYLADIIKQARQEGFDYLVIDPDKGQTESLPIVYTEQ